ncbi:MAG: tRNA pseudouridine(55) synthase TruB [Campylobacterota bacterium]|nr:tRNA pseudouridine(55) synthase TruB [Campylobacterota bacterium]
MNRLFVVRKPVFISSNFYLNRIKRKYKNKKAGFSGTLDPFACGSLIVAFGQYSKLFRFLKKTPKSYRATIFLGALSESLDNENIYDIKDISELNETDIKQQLQSLLGTLEYLPPKYSAKKIDGKRAYNLAREGIDFEMKKITSEVYDVKFINYCHPFITFDITVSEGSYIRSMAQILLERLDLVGTLSYLERLHEGEFYYDDEKSLNPLNYLDLSTNNYTGTKEWFDLGKKLDINYFETKDDGEYLISFDTFFAVVQIKDMEVKYILNKVLLEDHYDE